MKFKDFLNITSLFESYRDENSISKLPVAERWLASYTLEGTDKYPSQETLDKLLVKYPFDGGTLYRGLNFHDEKQYEKFMEETKQGTVLTTGSISSWTRSPEQARQFALTRPTYFLSRELMQAEGEKSKNRDFMIGHAGLILTCKVDVGNGFDVSKSRHAKEDEIILKPNTYKINIYKKMMPFVKSITVNNYKTEFMSISNLKGNEDEVKKFEHIMFRFKELDEEMRAHLWKLIRHDLKDVKYFVEVNKMTDFESREMGKTKKELYVDWNLPGTFFLYYELLLSNAKQEVDALVNGIIKKIDAKFDEVANQLDWRLDKITANVGPSLQYAAKQGHVSPKFIQKIRQGTAIRYHELNSYKEIKAINKLSGHDQEEAIKLHTQNIMAALKNLGGR